MTLEEFVAALPKVELHLHLEGSIPLDTLWRLVERHGGHPEAPDPEALRARFEYDDFDGFIRQWIWKNQFLRTPEDFQTVGRDVSLWLARSKVRYAEAFFSPGDFERHGLTIPAITEALDDGLRQGEETGGAQVRLIVDLIRDFGPEVGLKWLREVHRCSCPRVIGIGIGGSEHTCPPEPYAPVYDRARDLGYRVTAHAGEVAGADSVRGCLEVLGVERVGHGTRAGEDPTLVRWLAESGVPLEMCPTSNVCTGVVARLEEHPLASYLRSGVRVTINTDDPAMFHTDMNAEMVRTARALGLSRPELVDLCRHAVEGSWAPEEQKRLLLAELQETAARLPA